MNDKQKAETTNSLNQIVSSSIVRLNKSEETYDVGIVDKNYAELRKNDVSLGFFPIEILQAL